MKKHISKIVKGALLSFVFILAFNLNVSINSESQQDTITSNFNTSVFAGNSEDSEYGLDIEGLESAEATEASKTEALDFDELTRKIAKGATILHRIFHPMINFFAVQIGNFLGTDYIFADAMGVMLKKIWTISRNLVNIVFVFVLLFLALKQIFWVNEEGGADLKKNLIKFTLLLVAVNFSWLGTKLVLDSANVVTNAVFSIPMGIDSTGAKLMAQPCDIKPAANPDGAEVGGPKYTTGCIPYQSYVPITAVKNSKYQYLKTETCVIDGIEAAYDNAWLDGNTKNPAVDEDNKKYQEMGTFCVDSIDLAKYNANTSMIYLTYGMARIQNVAEASSDDSFTQMAIAALMSLFIQLAYTIALLALFLAMIIRMAMLWIFVAFSPFLVLMLYSEKFSPETLSSKFSIQQFARWAFVPAKVGAVFTIAFIMVSTGQTLGSKNETFFDTLASGSSTIQAKIYKIDSLFMGMNSLQEFIWLMVTLVILWMGVFAILNDMPIIGSITKVIDDYGTRTAKVIAKSPYWAPIMPMIDKEGKLTVGSYAKEYGGLINLPRSLEQMQNDYTHGDINRMEDSAMKYKKSDAARKSFVKKYEQLSANELDSILKEIGVDRKKAKGMLANGMLRSWFTDANFNETVSGIIYGQISNRLGGDNSKTDKKKKGDGDTTDEISGSEGSGSGASSGTNPNSPKDIAAAQLAADKKAKEKANAEEAEEKRRIAEGGVPE